MKDRVPVYPGRVKLVPVSGLANTYDMTRADSATQEGTALNKANLLSDDTEKLIFGSAQNKTPNDALAELTNRATRPNLLDNWCFLPGYVVNQRGKTDLTGGGYGIDRWSTYPDRTSPNSVESDGIHLSCDGTKTEGHCQYILSSSLVVGKQYTLSALVKVVSDTRKGDKRNVALSYGNSYNGISGSLYVKNADVPIGEWTCVSYTFSALETDSVTSNVRIRMGISGATEIIVAAMKLELGDTQTLAHQDADGNWVLNEYPDYNEQLLRCCMSTADPDDTYANGRMPDNTLLNQVNLYDGVNTVQVMKAYDDGDDKNYGSELVIGANGNTFVGSGESAVNLQALLVGGGDIATNEQYGQAAERMYLCSDQHIYLETNCNTVADRKVVQIDNNGQITAPGGFAVNLTSGKAKLPKAIIGTYTGTGVIGTAQSITVGFEPSAVFVLRSSSSAGTGSDGTNVGFFACIKSGDNQGKLTSAKMSSATNAYTVFNDYIEITSTGFSVLRYHSTYVNSPNEANAVYTYIAIG